jgi:hypothetical protein
MKGVVMTTQVQERSPGLESPDEIHKTAEIGTSRSMVKTIAGGLTRSAPRNRTRGDGFWGAGLMQELGEELLTNLPGTRAASFNRCF